MGMKYKADSLEELLAWSVFDTDINYARDACNLFHYTSASNEEKILRQSVIDLRLTRADAFADENEGKHVVTVFADVIKTMEEKQEIDKEYADALRASIEDYTPFCEKLRERYVFCFSKDDENKYLIENYAKKNGASGLIIGIQEIALEEITLDRKIDIDGQYNGVHLFDVLYDKEQLGEKLESLIKRAYKLRTFDNECYSLTRKIFLNQLAMYGLVYKAPCFAKEKECRMVVDTRRTVTGGQSSFQYDDAERECYLHLHLPTSYLYSKRVV